MIFLKTVDQNEKEHQIQYIVCKPKNMGLLDYGQISIFLGKNAWFYMWFITKGSENLILSTLSSVKGYGIAKVPGVG